MVIDVRADAATAERWQVVVPRIRLAFGHVVLPELFMSRTSDLKTRHWPNLVSIHRTDELGRHQDQEFVLVL